MQEQEKQPATSPKRFSRIKAIALAIVVLILLLPLCIYIPFVQNAACNFACKKASEATGLDIRIERISLKPVLDIGLNGFVARDPQTADTLLAAESLTLKAKLLPLIWLEIDIDEAALNNSRLHYITSDSSLVLNAQVQNFTFYPASVNLSDNVITLTDANASGGNIDLLYLREKVIPTPPNPSPTTWHIEAQNITLDNINYSMRMLPQIDTLQVALTHAELHRGMVDTRTRKVFARSLSVNGIDARYIFPTAEVRANAPKPVPNPYADPNSPNWTVQGDSVSLSNAHGIYALAKHEPGKGIDFNYLEISNAGFEVTNFFNQGLATTVPIQSLKLTERCGLAITRAQGTFAIDSALTRFDGIELHTLLSDAALDGTISTRLLTDSIKSVGDLKLALNSNIDLNDVRKAFPAYDFILRDIPAYQPLSAQIEVAGDAQKVSITKAKADLPHYASATVTGSINQPFMPKKADGKIHLDAQLHNINFVKPTVLSTQMQKTVNFPPVRLTADASLRGNDLSAKAFARLESGTLLAEADFNTKSSRYDFFLDAEALPLHAFLPKSAFGDFTGQLSATGQSFDFLNPKTSCTADADIQSLIYHGERYHDMSCHVVKDGQKVTLDAHSGNEGCAFNLYANGDVSKYHSVINLDGDFSDLDLRTLGVTKVQSEGSTRFSVFADLDEAQKDYKLRANITNAKWTHNEQHYTGPELRLVAASDKHSSSAHITNADFIADFASPCGLDSLLYCFKQTARIVSKQISAHALDVDSLHTALPHFTASATMGTNNLPQQILSKRNMSLKNAELNIEYDKDIHATAKAFNFTKDHQRIDSLIFNIHELNDHFTYTLHMGNKKGTFDDFAKADLSGELYGSTITANLTQRNIDDKKGYQFGINASLGDTVLNLHLTPLEPTINYRQWSINEDNFLSYNYRTQYISANLQLQQQHSLIKLVTQQSEKYDTETLQLQVKDLEIADWIKISPFAPPTSGVVNAQFDIAYKGDKYWGDAQTSVSNLLYEGKKIGDFDLDAKMNLDPVTGCTKLIAGLGANGAKVLSAAGVLNDSTRAQPMQVAVKVDSLPLIIVNPFLPAEYSQLSGVLCGKLTAVGTVSEPVINGTLSPVNSQMTIPFFGTSLAISETPIPINGNHIAINQLKLTGASGTAATVNGSVDITELTDPLINVRFQGNNVQVVNSKQMPDSKVFGRGFVNLQGSAIGKLSQLAVNATVSMLSGSNVTYVMQDNVSSLTKQSNSNMVHFVSFTDTIDTAKQPWNQQQKKKSGMSLNAALTVQQGSTLNIFLSPDGINRINAQGSGSLNYSQDYLGTTRLTGQYTISQGQVRYRPPLIPEKLFNFNSGSSITFTGEMLNPMLNLSAVQTQRSSISKEGGNSHLVDFLISAYIKGSLKNMDLSFDLSTNDDLTVANELQSMSAEQRSQQAINLMLYNSYTGSSSSSNSGNPLFSFLQSQLNNWAANTIKGIDLSFGINQYDSNKQANTTAYSYSYKLSKSLFNDRFKIAVGGNYSTDATAGENFSDNLISDRSFEYLLNSACSMYIRLYRHTGFESVLEGQITKMGASFVIKRKLSSLKNLFRFRKSRNNEKPSDVLNLETTDSVPQQQPEPTKETK